MQWKVSWRSRLRGDSLLLALNSFRTLFLVSHTHTKCVGAFLPWGCVYKQRPVELVPDPQWAPRCRQPGREDTRTGPEPLEKHTKHDSEAKTTGEYLREFCWETISKMLAHALLLWCMDLVQIPRNADKPAGRGTWWKTFTPIKLQWDFHAAFHTVLQTQLGAVNEHSQFCFYLKLSSIRVILLDWDWHWLGLWQETMGSFGTDKRKGPWPLLDEGPETW